MKNFLAVALFVLATTSLPSTSAAGPPGSGEPPVKIAISVSPSPVASGADAAVSVQLEPNSGIKLNKYPKIKVQVPAVAGVVGAAEQSMGNPAPPPADQLDSNYFHGAIDPLKLTLHTEASATKGRHEVPAKVSYFYCVAASGYCAPFKADVTIPITVR